MLVDRTQNWLVVTLLLCTGFLAGGCTHTYVLDNTAVEQWPNHETLNMSVNLVLSDEFAKASLDKEMMGDHFIFPVGPVLVTNAEAMSRRAFSSVSVTRGSKPDAAGVDAVLTPHVDAIERSASMLAFEKIDMTLDLRWTLTDTQGQILWARTIRGVANHHQGNIFTHKGESRTQVSMLMADLFSKSLQAITTAPEVRQLAR